MKTSPLHSLLRRAGAAIVLTLFAAAGPVAAPAADPPYEVQVILPLTGSVALLGNSVAKALGLLEDNVNKTGGIHGRPLKFVIGDDQSNPQVSVQLANAIIASKAPIIIGPSLNATCSSVAPLLKDGPVGMCLSPGIHPDPGSYNFSAAPSTLDLAIVTAHYAKKRGWKKIAFLITTDASGIDGERVLGQAFDAPDAKGTSIIDVEHFAVTSLTVAAQIARIKAANPDALYIWASGTPSITALRGLADAGLNIPVLTSYSNATFEQLNAMKGFIPKEFLMPGPPTIVPPDQLARGKLRDAVANYYRTFDAAGMHPDVLQSSAWDAAQIVVSALRHLGPSPTAAQIREYISELNGFVGVTGQFDFRAIPQRGVDWKSSVLMARWDSAKGSFTSVSPIGGN
jgi:branched-chain amino acid transport system substrate-binding protein